MERKTIDMVFLLIIIGAGLVANFMAMVYVLRKESLKSLKDKVIIALSLLNILQSIGFGIELNAAVSGN